MAKNENTIEEKKAYNFCELTKKQLIIGLIIVPFYFGILKYLILEPLMNIIINDKELVVFWVNLLRNIIILVAYIILLRKNIIVALQDFVKSKPKENIVWILKGALFFFIARTAYVFVVILTKLILGDKYTMLFGTGPQNQSAINGIALKLPVLMIIFSVVLTPILEELVFRYVLFHSLRRINKYLSMVVVSIVFAGMHVLREVANGQFIQAAYFMLPYLAIAIPFVILYEKRKNIVFCIILHAANNLLAQLL